MKVTISIPDELLIQADQFACQRGLNRSELFQRALQILFEIDHGDLIQDELNQVYGTEQCGLDQAIQRVQSEILETDDWK